MYFYCQLLLRMIRYRLLALILILLALMIARHAHAQILLQHATLIDGRHEVARVDMDVLIQGDTIAAVGQGLPSKGARVIDLRGKTIMPALISAHTHIGTLRGTTTGSAHYTRANVLAQLQKYIRYGVSTIQTMGTDRPFIFEGLRDSSALGLLSGARLHTAGYGFNVAEGALAAGSAMDLLYRPTTAAQVGAAVEELSRLKVDLIKMWVDDYGGTSKKMPEEIYGAIIREAHAHHLRVASHLYYLEDARKLVNAGLDIIAHSIRDQEVDAALLTAMKDKGVAYIPTLSLDEFSFIYARKPEWIDDTFFKASLEPGVWEMITDPKYQDNIRNSPAYDRNVKGFDYALRNVKKAYDAGVLVALGTDSGATPVRAQGFSEHLELELLVQAGLTPLQAIRVGTLNAARALRLDERYGTVEQGKVADLLVLSANPEKNIRQTRKIETVYKGGRAVYP
jgi:imidazolonepropionase-like amidohydrolase